MKKLSILALAAVGLLVGACSTKDVVEDVQNPNTLDGKGQGFLSVNVNLPVKTAGSTRVTDGEGDWTEKTGDLTRLDDGTANEYKVDDLLLIIFGGDTEEDAVVKQVWSPTTVSDWNDVGDDPNQVTTRKKYVVKLEKGISGPYWVLAVVNAHGIITKNDNFSIKINGEAKANCKLSDLQAAKVTANTTTGVTPFMSNNAAVDGFFMTNAVFSDQQGGHTDANVKALVLAPVETIYESESAADAANAAPSADIYVERGLAKVTVTASMSFDGSVKQAGGTTGDLAAPTLTGWVLDNTNMSSFVVRNAPPAATRAAEWGFYSRAATAGIDKFRFVGYNNVDASSPVYTESAYRTYWSPDPNYSTGYNKADFFEPATKTFPQDASKPQYCFENTFDVANQSYKNTTRVIAKVTLNDGETFYTIGGDRKTLYQLDDVRKAIAARIMLNEDFKTWVNNGQNGVSGTVTEANFGNITFNKDDETAGTVKVTDIQFKKNDGDAMGSFKDIVREGILNDALNYIGKIQQYPGGVTYYAIRIKHFGDDLTPWGWNGETEPTADDDTDAKKIAKIYPAGNANVGTADENYLGRYGVLRNNWYELSLGKILKIGHPIVPWLNPDNDPNDPTDPDPDNPNPEDPDHPDDSLDDSYISARINILSWAKRPQNIILK